MGRAGIRRMGWLGKLFWSLFILLVAAPVLLLLIFRFLPPPGTPQMIWSLAQGKGAHYRWSDNVPSFLGRAVIGSEDQNFCNHAGFDWKSIDQAMAAHERNPAKRLRGASTISQQVAKNVFLWQGRDYIRKGLEIYFTKMIEWIWGKQRILDVYLNVIEMGPGLFGAEAAAQSYFKKPAKNLTRREAALMAACLPNPKKYTVRPASPYVAARAGWILQQMNNLEGDEDVQKIVKP